MGTRSSGKRNPTPEVKQILEDEIVEFLIYARKSTDESTEKQAASIPQQIEACYDHFMKEDFNLAKRPKDEPLDEKTLMEIDEDNLANPDRARDLKAFYVEHWIITERKSAKEPKKRKKWTALIKAIKAGNVRGVFGYSPDRISRNLQEGGELINLVDNDFVQLKFTNFHFENNAAGQMMLGFWFVFAEHYSKKLSEDVSRGTAKKHLEGRAAGVRKYGYAQDTEDRFIPDPFHFPILRQAFERKLKHNWSDTKIADEMNAMGWNQVLKEQDDVNRKMTEKKISNYSLWSSSFYYGVWKRTFNNVVVEVDLRTMDYPDYQFTPLLSEEEWLMLQEKLSDYNAKAVKKRMSQRSKRLEPARPAPNDLLTCKECGKSLQFNIPNIKRHEKNMAELKKPIEDVIKPHQIKFRCTNKECPNAVNINWDVIDEKIGKLFKNIKVDKEEYQAYLYALREDLKDQSRKQGSELQRIDMLINKKASEQKRFHEKTNYGVGLTGKRKENWEKQDRGYEADINDLEKRRAFVREDSRDLLYEERAFVETIKSLSKKWKKATYVQKHELVSQILLNITVDNENNLKIAIKPSLESLFVRSGAARRI